MRRHLPCACFYLHQGMVSALVLQGVVGYFRQAGLELVQLSWLSLTLLPWVTKFLWAPWCERHALPLRGGHYLGSLALLQLGMAAVLVATGLLPPTRSVGGIVVALTLLNLLSASHGIYANGIVIRSTDAHTRPVANVVQVGASYLGIPFGTLGFLMIAQNAGWQLGFFGVAALSLLLLAFVLAVSQPTSPATTTDRPRLDWRSMREAGPALALTVLCYTAMRGMLALQSVFLVDQGLSLTALGQASMVYGTLASGIGIVIGGVFARRLGAWRSIPPVMCLHAVLIATVALGFPHIGRTLWVGLFGLLNLAAAIGFVVLYNALMSQVRPHQPASDYALFQSTDMAVALLVSMVTLRMAQHTGYQVAMALCAVVATSSLWPAWRLCRRFAASASLAPPATPLSSSPEASLG